MIQANAVARKGADDAPLRRAIDQRLFRTAEWRRGEGALPLGRLTEPQPKQASSFLDDKAVEVAKVDTGVRNDGAEYEGWTGTLPNVGDTADPSWDEYQALVSRSQPKRSLWQKAAKVYDDLPGLWTLPGFAENKEKAEWLAPAASAAAAAAPAFGLSLQAGSTGGRILGGALAAYLEGAYEAMLRGAKPEDVVRQGLQSAPYGAVGMVATQLDDLPVPDRNTLFGGVPGPTGRSAEAEPKGEADTPSATPKSAAREAASDGGFNAVIRDAGLTSFVKEKGLNPELVANYVGSQFGKRFKSLLRAARTGRSRGKRGSALEQLNVDQQRETLESLGFLRETGGRQPERAVAVKGGIKRHRFPDLTLRAGSGPDEARIAIQSGRLDASGAPIRREREALDDLRRARLLKGVYLFGNNKDGK